jgi:hypothetical protein
MLVVVWRTPSGSGAQRLEPLYTVSGCLVHSPVVRGCAAQRLEVAQQLEMRKSASILRRVNHCLVLCCMYITYSISEFRRRLSCATRSVLRRPASICAGRTTASHVLIPIGNGHIKQTNKHQLSILGPLLN